MRIVAYVYEADIHCPECAANRFGVDALDDIATVDCEGNTVSGHYSWEFEDHEACGDCHNAI